jgi:primosomal protein N' (replication factor Y)
MTGYAVQLSSRKSADAPDHLKEVTKVIDPGPLFPADLLKVTRWMADYYLCGWGEVLRAAMPHKAMRRRSPESSPDELPPLEGIEGEEVPRYELTPQQRRVLVPMSRALHEHQYLAAVLHGVTDSGKTAVYESLVAQALEQERGAIVLVPEISITPQMISIFYSRFGSKVTLFHSRLKASDRYARWRRVLAGDAMVVIGPRSAVLAPVANLGVIVVDEEHEPSYKQSEPAPRYHARDVAVFRARECDAVCVLGSATPSAESYNNALEGKYLLLEMKDRISSSPITEIRLVDMSREPKPWERTGGETIFSRVLEEAIEARLERGEQSLLFLNRRGFSPALTCRNCGHAEECTNCSVAMTYHRLEGHLRCHYCGSVRQPPLSCPDCGGEHLRYQGLGTQRVETALNERFPEACVLRMDSDSTRRRGSHGRLYRAFASGDGDILLGTQMVAKGFHFPRVTLVGVISADSELHFPDFRANERTFQLLTQVAGRAGRGDQRGEVIIQTFSEENPGISFAAEGDFAGFMSEELRSRRALSYPPYGRMIRVLLRGRKETDVLEKGREIVLSLRRVAPATVEVLGPAPAPLYRLNRWYRVHFFLRGRASATLRKCVEASQIMEFKRPGMMITVDIDAVDIL